jgi:hypothetical protein
LYSFLLEALSTPTADLKLLGMCGVAFSKPTSLLATAMVKGEPLTKRAREGDEAMPMVKEDDAVPMVNQDEALVGPFRDRDDWAIDIMRKAFLKIKSVLQLGACMRAKLSSLSSLRSST